MHTEIVKVRKVSEGFRLLKVGLPTLLSLLATINNQLEALKH